MAHCKSMRHVVAGGEALTPALAARFQQRLPSSCLHNTYGPTEATIDITGGPARTCVQLSVCKDTIASCSTQ